MPHPYAAGGPRRKAHFKTFNYGARCYPQRAMTEVAGLQVSSIKSTFLVQDTKARRSKISRIIKALGESPSEDDHLLGASFLATSEEAAYFAHLHIHSYDSGKATKLLFVEVGFKMKPRSRPPRALANRPHRAEWMHDQVLGLVGPKALAFLDAVVFVPGTAPPKISGLPLTLGGRILPIVGAEYAVSLQNDGITKFRWSMEGEGLMVRLSYSRELELAQLGETWTRESITISQYVKEAFEG